MRTPHRDSKTGNAVFVIIFEFFLVGPCDKKYWIFVLHVDENRHPFQKDRIAQDRITVLPVNVCSHLFLFNALWGKKYSTLIN